MFQTIVYRLGIPNMCTNFGLHTNLEIAGEGLCNSIQFILEPLASAEVMIDACCRMDYL